MKYSKFAFLGVVLLGGLVGCGPRVGVPQPYPLNYLVRDRPVRETYRRAINPYPEPVAADRVVVREPDRVLTDERIVARRPVRVVRAPTEVLDLKYVKESEMTIRDVVLGKRYVKLPDGYTGVVVTLQPGGEYIDVLVGTTTYLADHEFDIGIADPLMVSGSLLQLSNRSMLLAKEVTWRGHTLKVRDAEGKPLWDSNYNLAGW